MLEKMLPETSTISLDFILCIERTGSSMLSAMMNSHGEILSSSEEPFALYLHSQYKNKASFSEKEIEELLLQFKRTSEKNLDLYFSPLESLKKTLLQHKDDLPFEKLCKLIYLHFLPLRSKEGIKHIIDKQIKYILYAEKIASIFPHSKFVVLTRDYHDVISSWKKRGLGNSAHIAYIAEVWNLSYKKALSALKKFPDRMLLIRYENLVENPEATLSQIAKHLSFEFRPEMIAHHTNFQKYIEEMKEKVSPDFMDRLKDFHSNTLNPVNKDLIGEWKKKLSTHEIAIIERICSNTGKELGYDYSSPKITLSFSEKLAIAKARFNKLVYLDVYIRTPLPLKTIVKKYRPNKIQE